MNKIYTLLLFLSFSVVSYSQVILSLDDDTVYIDSIVRYTKNVKSDSIKSLNSFRLAKLFLMVQDAEKYKEFLAEGNRLKTKFPFVNDAALYYNAYSFVEKGDLDGYEKALLQANEKLKKYRYKEAYRLRAIVLQNYGILQQHKN
ncbi:MAG TPA: two-component sensor histidine kinase, partial [Flavobacterium sp.]|nr:two-component sensor histidine kinase [Flavobacterium sp.]